LQFFAYFWLFLIKREIILQPNAMLVCVHGRDERLTRRQYTRIASLRGNFGFCFDFWFVSTPAHFW